jgi:NADH-quinone oxidoreductase subunit H
MPELLKNLSEFLDPLLPGPIEVAVLACIFLVAFVLINFMAVFAGLCTYGERKIAGHIQARVGPYMVGPHGILQWLADAVKLILKEDIIPEKADSLLFRAAPYVVFAGSFACWMVLPLWPGFAGSNLNVGVLFLIALGSSVVLGILMSGWASANKWALFGAMRSAAQIVSYEIPAGLTVLAVLLIVGSLNLHDISGQQAYGRPFPLDLFGTGDPGYWGAGSWFIFRYLPFSLIAALIMYTCALAETNRVPFDIPEAESELVAGYHTEYTGFRFSIFFLSEYGNMFVASALVTVLFLGGWLPPFPKVFDHYIYDVGEDGTKTYSMSKGEKLKADALTLERTESVLDITAAKGRVFRLQLDNDMGQIAFPAIDASGRVSHDQGYQVKVDGTEVLIEKGKMIPGIWFAAKMKAPVIQYLEGLFWMLLKVLFLIFFMMWLRWTIPRYRVDQLMELCWKKLTPLAFVNLFVFGLLEGLPRWMAK